MQKGGKARRLESLKAVKLYISNIFNGVAVCWILDL